MRTFRVLILAAAVGACDSPTANTDTPNVQTGSASYFVEDAAFGGIVIKVDITFTNTLPETVYIGHCGGMPSRLEKRLGLRWMPVGGEGTLDCGGTTAVLDPGETYSRTIQFIGMPRGSNSYPQFETDDLPGEYRIVLTEVATDRSEGDPVGRLIPHRQRTSNTFTVVD
jgi:hypothetical protein